MNNLVIGGSGFIGQYLIRDLLKAGHHVLNIDPKRPSVFDFSHESKYSYLNADIRTLSLELPYIGNLKGNKFDNIILLAAKLGGISYFAKFPFELAVYNSEVASSVFRGVQYIVQLNSYIPRLIIISSSMVYERVKKFPSNEGDELKAAPPITSYGMQKLFLEYLAKSFFSELQVPYLIVRPFNAVGPGDFPEEDSHVIPHFIKKSLEKQVPFEILGTGKQIRCFTDVRDVASGICILAGSSIKNEDFNLANPCPMTMLELAETIWKIINPQIPFTYKLITGFPYDVQKRIPSIKKIKKLTNWGIKFSIRDSLIETINWIKSNIS